MWLSARLPVHDSGGVCLHPPELEQLAAAVPSHPQAGSGQCEDSLQRIIERQDGGAGPHKNRTVSVARPNLDMLVEGHRKGRSAATPGAEGSRTLLSNHFRSPLGLVSFW